MVCDICGKDGTNVKAIIEGSEMNVCNSCSKFGKVIKSYDRPFKKRFDKKFKKNENQKTPNEVSEDFIVENYAKIIKQKRESLNLTLEELSNKLNEKESLIQKIESGHLRPNFVVAKKLQNFLKIRLIESFKEKKIEPKTKESQVLTIGDLIKIKK